MASVRRELKARLEKGETVVAPGAYDAMGARIVQSLGFPAIYTGGYMSGAHLAVTEPLMTMTEQVEVAKRVAAGADLPVICDAGAGYGDPVHTMHAVRTYENAGLAGMHIEDQVFPKRASYHKGLEHVIPMDEFLEKMRYALQARRDPDFVIIGRTDAFSAVEGSMDEAVRRGCALRDLGVDAVMPRGGEATRGPRPFSQVCPQRSAACNRRTRRHICEGVRGPGLPANHIRHHPGGGCRDRPHQHLYPSEGNGHHRHRSP